MSTNLERFKSDLDKLIKLGDEMSVDLTLRGIKPEEQDEFKEVSAKVKNSFEKNYQHWYTEAHAVLKQLVPDRLIEFVCLYHGEGKRKEINAITYNIQDWLNGITSSKNSYTGEKHFNDFAIVVMRFETQLKILKSVTPRFESSLFDIARLVRADLFDSEVDAARELAKHGFLRGAGAIAGVVIEKHLTQVCESHNVSIKKKEPAINDFNDALKCANVVDIPTMRQIQRLADIRNLCDHNKHREPTKDEVIELVDGADKLCKTLF